MTSPAISLTAETIQQWLISNLAEQLEVEPEEIDPTLTFDSYGLDSAQATRLMDKAEKILKFRVSLLLFWHYPTIEALSQRLAEEFEESDLEVFEI